MNNTALKSEIWITVKHLSDISNVHLTTIRRRVKSGKDTARLVDGKGGKQYEILLSSVEPELQEKFLSSQPNNSLSEQGVSQTLPVGKMLPAPFSSDVTSGVVQAPQKAKDEALAKYELLRNWESFYEDYGKESEESFATQMSQLDDLCRNSENRHRLMLFTKDIKISIDEIATLLRTTKRTIQRNCKEKKLKFETEPSRGTKGEKYLVYLSNLPEDKQIEYFLANQQNYPEIVEMMLMANKEQAPVKKKVSKMQVIKEFIHLYNEAKLYPAIYEQIGKISVNTLYRWKNMVGETKDYSLLIPQYQYSLGQYRTQISQIEIDTFRKIILSQNKMKISEAYNWTKRLLQEQGFTDFASESSYRRWAEHFIKNHYDVWVYAREGRKSYDDKVKHCIKRDYSLIGVGDIFVADGHRLDFNIKHPFTGKPCRALIVAYQDMKSCAIAGFEIMINENTQCVASALRNSIINFGRIPKICYQDNGKAFKNKFFKGSKDFVDVNLQGLFERLEIKTIFSKPYNSKAKPIEGFWKIFGEFERIVDSYVGNNIENKPAYLKRNEKYHESINSGNLPTLEQTVSAVQKYIDIYHRRECPHIKGCSIQEVWDEAKGQGVDIEKLDELMMSEETRKINKNGVKFLNMYYWSNELSGLKQKVINE